MLDRCLQWLREKCLDNCLSWLPAKVETDKQGQSQDHEHIRVSPSPLLPPKHPSFVAFFSLDFLYTIFFCWLPAFSSWLFFCSGEDSISRPECERGREGGRGGNNK